MAVRSLPERRVSAGVGTNRSLGSIVRQSASSDLTEPATSPQETGLEARVRFLESRLKSLEQLQYKPAVRMERRSTSANGTSPFSVFGTTPEIRRVETDQTDPAGQYRDQVSGDAWLFQRALTAAWATLITFFQLDYPSSQRRMYFPDALRIHYGNGSIEIWHNAGVKYTSNANSGDSYEFGANNTSSVYQSVAVVGNATDPAGSNNPFWKFVNQPVYFLNVALRGGGTQPFVIQVNPATTGTARRFAVDVLNPSVGHVRVAQAVPNTANPFWTQLAPDATPTASELDADNITFTYTKATDTVKVHVNEGGVIKSGAVVVVV